MLTLPASLEATSTLPGRVRWRVAGMRDNRRRAHALTDLLSATVGVRDATASPVTGRVLVRFDEAVIGSAELERLIVRSLARPVPEDGHLLDAGAPGRQLAHAHEHEEGGLGGFMARLVAGGVALVGIVIHKLFFAPLGLVSPGLAFGIGVAVTIISGYPFFRGGVRALVGGGAADTDTLVTAATLASVVLRESVTALLVLWLLNLGELLQAVVLRRSRRAIRELLSVGDREAWVVLADGVEVRVLLTEIRVGDLVAVYAGERIPVDGVVESGQATVNQMPITGESMAVFRNPGEDVYAGTVVEAGSVRVRARQVGDATAVAQLIKRVEEARELKAPIETIGAQFSRRFVPASFALAGLVFLATRDVRRAVTILVVACPCAAGLATPTAVSATIGNAARRGILVKGGASLEGAARVDAVVFDKTGTLTSGRPQVTRVIALDPQTPPEQLLSLAASGELHSPHPLALAVLSHTRERELEIPAHEQCELLVGRGMRAEMQTNRILVGSRRLMEEFGLALPPETEERVQQMRAQGDTVLYVGLDDRFAGLIGVADVIRPEAAPMLEALARLGIARLVMLSGDATENAEVVARRLRLAEFKGELLPEDKLAAVRTLQADGYRVAMVGDGINDAPSLAAADLGIAIGTGGADVAIEAADVALAANDLATVGTVVQLSRRTLRVVKQNYGLALGVNSLGIVVGALGALNPVAAAVLHNLSTLAVLANSSRLIGYRPDGSG